MFETLKNQRVSDNLNVYPEAITVSALLAIERLFPVSDTRCFKPATDSASTFLLQSLYLSGHFSISSTNFNSYESVLFTVNILLGYRQRHKIY